MLTHVHKCWKLGGVNTFAQGMKKRRDGGAQPASDTDARGKFSVR